MHEINTKPSEAFDLINIDLEITRMIPKHSPDCLSVG